MILTKNGPPGTIAGIVQKNTGMTEEELLNDRKVYKIHNLDEVRDRIQDAMSRNVHIDVFGDYDVDGICASAIMKIGFDAVGYGEHVTIRLPKRFSEGYGISETAIGEFRSGDLLITVDNGIAASSAIRKAKEKGMDVIVIDHHIPDMDEEEHILLPDADLIIDPKAFPEETDFHGYCGAGLAYRVMCKLRPGKKTATKMLTLAAVATIADSVPLTGENRRIVKYGMEAMINPANTTVGLYALLSACGRNEYVAEEDIAFKIAPCLNATGRLEDDGAMKSFELVSYEGNLRDAREMAEAQMESNMARRSLSDEGFSLAKEAVSRLPEEERKPLVLFLPGIQEGIVGIIAGKTAESMKTPCILVTESESDSTVYKGSARTYGEVDLYHLIKTGADELLKFGGHKEAAGLSLKKENFEAFRRKMAESFRTMYPDMEEEPGIRADIEVHAENRDALLDLIREINRFRPYGQGNPAPVVSIKNLVIVPDKGGQFRYLGDHAAVKLTAVELDCVSFDDIDRYELMGAPAVVNVAGVFSRNYFMGRFREQLEFFEIQESELNKKKKSPLASLIAERSKGRTAGTI